MTTANPTQSPVHRPHFGTLTVLGWTGDPQAGHNTPYLLVYTLGDGQAGPAAASAAMVAMIEELGLSVGPAMTDATHSPPAAGVRLLVEGGHAVLTLPYLSAQCPVPPEWLAAAELRGHAHLIIATRPWPEAAPGREVTEELLQDFLGGDENLMTCGHVLLPVSQLRR
ncbi:DUF5949 family protein [Streptomyces sp. NPDC057638]|uniref:DUF5949 family protein n=1 Tax=Streptomyces sp. NPDC057638 TaxID=3346190 RepID=UPI003684F9F5